MKNLHRLVIHTGQGLITDWSNPDTMAAMRRQLARFPLIRYRWNPELQYRNTTRGWMPFKTDTRERWMDGPDEVETYPLKTEAEVYLAFLP
jgi:hypothetical protein